MEELTKMEDNINNNIGSMANAIRPHIALFSLSAGLPSPSKDITTTDGGTKNLQQPMIKKVKKVKENVNSSDINSYNMYSVLSIENDKVKHSENVKTVKSI